MKKRHITIMFTSFLLSVLFVVGGVGNTFGKYTGMISGTLVNIIFSNYYISGDAVAIGTGENETVPDDMTDNLWGAGDGINSDSSEIYGFDDFKNIGFMVVNNYDEPVYMTFVVTMALPHKNIINASTVVGFSAPITITAEHYDADGNKIEESFRATLTTSSSIAGLRYTRKLDANGAELGRIYRSGLYNYYLYEVIITTDIILQAHSDAYLFNLNVDTPTPEEWADRVVVNSIGRDSAYQSVHLIGTSVTN